MIQGMEILPFWNKGKPIVAAAVLGLALALTGACGETGDGDPPAGEDPAGQPPAGDEPALSVTTPADGDAVTVPFEVSVDSNVELGAITEELHHLHVWFGDLSGQPLIIESDTTMIEDAPNGETTMIVQVHTFDHVPASEPVEVSLVVEGGSGGDPGPPDY